MITSFTKLIQKITRSNFKNISMIFKPSNECKYILEIYKNNELLYIYDGEKLLYPKKNRSILSNPSYDEVFEFLYYQFKCPLGLILHKPLYLTKLNKIYII